MSRSLELAIGAAALAVAGGAFWYYFRESYYTYVPLCYQYRPGTMTGYFSKVLAKHAKRRRRHRPIRVYMDGCFDMMHYGHANALRQAASLGDELVVGLIPDREILRCKGPPLLDENERLELVESVKWVDEVLTGVPYDLTPEFLEELFTKHRIDYVIHGDDPCILPDGTDAYAYAKKSGRFRLIKRTEGVSTTDIVGRMLMCSRNNSRFVNPETRDLTKMFSMGTDALEAFSSSDEDSGEEEATSTSLGGDATVSVTPGKLSAISTQKADQISSATVPYPSSSEGVTPRKAAGVGVESRPVTVSRFMPTSRRIVQFSSGKVAPPGSKIVYIDGAFDLFHVGHVEILKAARQEGDFLLVGVHTDEDVTKRRGAHLPIMELHERALSVLACRYTDEVIIGAPSVITEDLLTTFNINLVVRGTMHEITDRKTASEDERYRIPSQRNILKYLTSPSSTTSAELIQRIVKNRQQFESRQEKKKKSEKEYYETAKEYVAEI